MKKEEKKKEDVMMMDEEMKKEEKKVEKEEEKKEENEEEENEVKMDLTEEERECAIVRVITDESVQECLSFLPSSLSLSL